MLNSAQHYGVIQKRSSGLILPVSSALPSRHSLEERLLVRQPADNISYQRTFLWPHSDSNRDSLTGNKAVNALPYFTSLEWYFGVTPIAWQTLFFTARGCKEVIPVNCGTINFYRRLFLLSYETFKPPLPPEGEGITLNNHFRNALMMIQNCSPTAQSFCVVKYFRFFS